MFVPSMPKPFAHSPSQSPTIAVNAERLMDIIRHEREMVEKAGQVEKERRENAELEVMSARFEMDRMKQEIESLKAQLEKTRSSIQCADLAERAASRNEAPPDEPGESLGSLCWNPI